MADYLNPEIQVTNIKTQDEKWLSLGGETDIKDLIDLEMGIDHAKWDITGLSDIPFDVEKSDGGVDELEEYLQVLNQCNSEEEAEVLFFYTQENGIPDELPTDMHSFNGVFREFRDFSDELLDELIGRANINTVSPYLDYDSFADDLKTDYDVIELDGGRVAIFRQ